MQGVTTTVVKEVKHHNIKGTRRPGHGIWFRYVAVQVEWINWYIRWVDELCKQPSLNYLGGKKKKVWIPLWPSQTSMGQTYRAEPNKEYKNWATNKMKFEESNGLHLYSTRVFLPTGDNQYHDGENILNCWWESGWYCDPTACVCVMILLHFCWL